MPLDPFCMDATVRDFSSEAGEWQKPLKESGRGRCLAAQHQRRHITGAAPREIVLSGQEISRPGILPLSIAQRSQRFHDISRSFAVDICMVHAVHLERFVSSFSVETSLLGTFLPAQAHCDSHDAVPSSAGYPLLKYGSTPFNVTRFRSLSVAFLSSQSTPRPQGI